MQKLLYIGRLWTSGNLIMLGYCTISRSFIHELKSCLQYGKFHYTSGRSNRIFEKRFNCLISQSTDIFENLAFEDWIYSNLTFEYSGLLLFWRNNKCVVIGRHQNPWAECNVEACDERRANSF